MRRRYCKPAATILMLTDEESLLAALSLDTSTAGDGTGNSEWGAKRGSVCTDDMRVYRRRSPWDE